MDGEGERDGERERWGERETERERERERRREREKGRERETERPRETQRETESFDILLLVTDCGDRMSYRSLFQITGQDYERDCGTCSRSQDHHTKKDLDRALDQGPAHEKHL